MNVFFAVKKAFKLPKPNLFNQIDCYNRLDLVYFSQKTGQT